MIEFTELQKRLLKLQQDRCSQDTSWEHRQFIFWDGYSQYKDDNRAAALDGLCKLELFKATDSEFGGYYITQKGLDYHA